MPLLEPYQYYHPLLRALLESPEGLKADELREMVFKFTLLTSEERLAPSQGRPRCVVLVELARTTLEHLECVTVQVVDSVERWVITAAGKEMLGRLQARYGAPSKKALDAREAESLLPLSPLERAERCVRELNEHVEAELAAWLERVSPEFLELTVLKLLSAMGYGKLEHTGGVRDGGIDGFLRGDPLGLNVIAVQVKQRGADPVTVEEIRTFTGALGCHKGLKGVFATNGRFSQPAEREASNDRGGLQLIDGPKLTALMVTYGIGVSRSRVQVLPEVDPRFFDS